MIWIALLGLAQAGTVDVEAPLTEVTVYRQQALVTRQAKVSLAAGPHTLVFSGLPATVDENSVTAKIGGAAEVDGIDLKRIPASEVANERARLIAERMDVITAETKAITTESATYHAELVAIGASRKAAAAQLNQQLLMASDAAGKLEATLLALRKEEDRVRDAMRVLRDQRLVLQAETQALQRERNEVSSQATDTYTAMVDVDVSRAGTVSVDLNTVMRSAAWTPVYDLRGRATGEVEVSLSAKVWQNTGEDWSDVRLTVSSAQPGRGTDAPRLDPFWLERPRPQPRPASKSAGRAAPAPMMMDSMEMSAPAPAAPPPPPPMEVATAVVSQELSATAFEVERSESIASDGTKRKVLLTTVDLEGDLSHVIVPRRDPKAYLVGEVTNTAGFPLLPGEAGVFLDSAFVGTLALGLVAPGDAFDVAFGTDDALVVHRRPVEVSVGKPATGKRARSTWTWEVVVDNGHRVPVKVEIREQVPLSRTDDVTVSLTGQAPSEEGTQGKLSFVGDVPARGSTTWTWGYEVLYPAERGLRWME